MAGSSLVDTLIVELLVKGKESMTDATIAVNLLDAAVDKATKTSKRKKAANDEEGASEERTTRARRSTTNEFIRAINSYDKASAAAFRYANAMDRVKRFEEDGIGTERTRTALKELVTKKMEDEIALINKTAEAQSANNKVMQESIASIDAMIKEVDALGAKYSPLTAAQKSNAASLAEITKAREFNVITAREEAVAIAQTTLAYEKQVVAIHAAANAAKAAFTTESIGHIQEYNTEIERLVQEYDKVGVAAAKYAKVEHEVAMVVAAGRLDQEQATKAIKDAAAARDAASGKAPAAVEKQKDAPRELAASGINKAIAELERLKIQYDGVYEAEVKLVKVQKDVDLLMSLGAGNVQQMTAAIREATKVRDDAASRAKGDPVIGPDADQHIRDYMARIEELKVKFDPLYAAEKKNLAAIREINEAFDKGSIGIDRWMRQLDTAKANFEESVRTINAADAPKPAARQADSHVEEFIRDQERLKRAYDLVYDAEKKHQAALADIANTPFETEERRAQAVNRATNAYQNNLKAIDKVNSSNKSSIVTSGQLNAAVTNLGFQFNDLATGLLSGQSPFTLIAQQGGQIIQAFNQGGGVKVVLSGFIENVKGMITPVTAAIAAVAALSAAIIGLALRQANVEARARTYSAVLDVMGGKGKTTAAELESVTKALETQGVELDKANQAVNALIKTPNMGLSKDNIADFAQLALNLSAFNKSDIVSEAAAIGAAFTRTADEAEAFNHKIGIEYTDAERAAIEASRAAGDELKRRHLEFIALYRAMDGQADKSKSEWQKSVEGLKQSWNEFLDLFGPTALNIVKFFFDSLKTYAQEAKGVIGTFFSGMDWLKNFTDETANKIRTKLGLEPNAPSAGGSGGPARDVAPRVAVTENAKGVDAPEIQKLIQILDKASSTSLAEGQKFQIFSAYRPGATVAGTGAPSLHGDAHAVDVRVVGVDNKIVDTGVKGLPSMGAGLITPAMEKAILLAATGMGEKVSLGSTFSKPDPGHVGIGAGTREVEANQDRQRVLLGGATTVSDGAMGRGGAVARALAEGKSPTEIAAGPPITGFSEEPRKTLGDQARDINIQRQVWGTVGLDNIRAQAKATAELAAQTKLFNNEDEKKLFITTATNAAVEQSTKTVLANLETEKMRTAGVIKTAEAYMGEGGEVAGLQAAAEAQAELNKRNNTALNVETEKKRILEANAAAAIEAGAKQLPAIGLQLAATNRLVDATVKGTAAEHEAQIQNQVVAATHNAVAEAIASGNPKLIEQAKLLEAGTAALIKRNDKAQQTYELEKQINQRNNQIDVLKLQQGLQFQTAEEIQRQVSLLQAKQDLEARGLTSADAIYQKTLANVDALGRQNIALAESQRAAGAINDAIKGVATTVDTTLTDAIESVLSGKKIKSWGDTFKQTISDISKQLISGLVVKPIIGSALSGAGFGKVGADFGSIGGTFGALGGLFGGGGGGGLFGGGEKAAPDLVQKDKEGNVIGTISQAASTAKSGGGLLGELGLGGSGSGGTGMFSGVSSFFDKLGPNLGFATGPNISTGVDIPGSVFGSTTLGGFASGVGLGFGAGSLTNMLAGGNKTTGTIGSGIGSLAGTAIGSFVGMPMIGGLLGGAAGGLLGGMFGGTKKPDAASGGVINLATGQVQNAQSGGNAENDATASKIGTVLSAAVTRALAIPGAKLPGGAVGIQAGSRDGIKLSFGGMEQKFQSADAAIAFGLNALRDNLTGVSDVVQKVIHSIGSPEQIEGALAFAQAYEDLAKSVDDAFKDVETAAKQGPFEKTKIQIDAVFSGMAQKAEEFGLAVEPVNKALEEATKRLNNDFAKAVDTAFNAATGRDFLTNIQGVIDGYESMARDASAIGADESIHNKLGATFNAELDNIFASLSGPQLDEVINKFGDLTNGLPELARAAKAAAEAAAALSREMDRQAAAYDIQQAFDQAAGQDYLAQLRDLDKARKASQANAKTLDLGDTRQGVIQETEHRAALTILQQLTNEQLALARTTLEELNPAFSVWVDEAIAAQRAVDNLSKAQQRATEIATAQANIQKYLNSLQVTQSPFTSGRGRLDAAQEQYNTMLTKAQGGDTDALAGITEAAQTLLTNVADYYASSAPGQAIFQQVQEQLRGLLGPAGAGAATGATTDDVVAAVTETGAATTGAIGSSTADMVNASIAASTAITNNSIQQNAVIMGAAKTANDNIVAATISSGTDMTNAALNSAGQIIGSNSAGFSYTQAAVMTGTGNVVASTSGISSAVVAAGADATSASMAILQNNSTNAKSLIDNNTTNAVSTITANENNAGLLRDASIAQTGAFLASNVSSAAIITQRTTDETAKLITANDNHTAMLVDKAQTTTDQAIATATGNTASIMAQQDASTAANLAELNAGTTKIVDTASAKSDALNATTVAQGNAAQALTTANTTALSAKHDQAIQSTAVGLASTTAALDAAQQLATGSLVASTAAATDRAVANQQATSATITAQATADSNAIIGNQAASAATIAAQATADANAVVANQQATGAAVAAQATVNSSNIMATQQTTAQQLAAQAAAGSSAIVATTAQTSADSIAQATAASNALAASASVDAQAIIGTMNLWGTATIDNLAAWFQASIGAAGGYGDSFIGAISNGIGALLNSETVWGNAILTVLNNGFGAGMNTANVWGSAIQGMISQGFGAALNSAAVWGSTINATINSWFGTLNDTVARYGEANISAQGGNAGFLANYVATYGDGVINSVNSGMNYVAAVLIDKFGWLVPRVEAWGSSIYNQIALWEQSVITQIGGSIGWLNDRHNEQNNAQIAVMANWGQAIITSQAAWDSSTIGVLNAGFNSVVFATGNISSKATVDAVLIAATNIIGHDWDMANWIVATVNIQGNGIVSNIASTANNTVAAVYGAADSIIGTIAAHTRWLVDTCNHDPVNETNGWLNGIYEVVAQNGRNEVSWNQNLYDMLATINAKMNWQFDRLYGETEFQGNYLEYLTEITVQYDQWMAHMTQAQSDEIAKVRDQLRKNAFG